MRDVLVIGSGGGGAVVAKELAARGLDVLVLEAGPRAVPERDWTHFENDQNSLVHGNLRFGPGDRTRPAWVREMVHNSAVLQVAGFGGTTQHYLGNSPRAMPGAFASYDGPDRNAYDTAHRFPFRYRDLLPYYEWVEATLPVATAAIGRKEEVFFDAAQRIGLPVQTGKDITRASFRPQENAILQPAGNAGRTADPRRLAFPAAQGCTFCGHCIQGCMLPLGAPRNLRAKRSTDNSYLPMAMTADLWGRGRAATVVPDAFATRIEPFPGGALVRWRDTRSGATAEEQARVVVLAAGAIESVRLWLNSGLPNPNDQVGRGLTDHAMDVVAAVLPGPTHASQGPGSGARADFPGRGSIQNVVATPASVAQGLNLSDAGIAGFYDNGLAGAARGADTAGRLVGTALKDFLADIDRLLLLLVLTDDDVEPQNRVTLAGQTPPDEHGPVPSVAIHGRSRSARTQSNREFLVDQAIAMARAVGGTPVHRACWPPTLFHLHSTLRMGSDPAHAVLDGHGEALHVPRLFVADNSALANALGGPNPTLTTQALATRTAERIFARYFGGAPWVTAERPIASVDPMVTRAVLARGL